MAVHLNKAVQASSIFLWDLICVYYHFYIQRQFETLRAFTCFAAETKRGCGVGAKKIGK